MVKSSATSRNRGMAIGKRVGSGTVNRNIGKISQLKYVALRASRALQKQKILQWTRLNWSPRRIHQTLFDEFHNSTVSYRGVMYHRRKLQLNDAGSPKPSPGRPRRENIDGEILSVHSHSPNISARKIAKQLKLPRETVRRHLHDMDAEYRAVQWVPHHLTPSQKNVRIDFAQKLLDHLKNKKNWPRTYTGDESWFHYDNPIKGKWVFGEDPAPVEVKPSLTPKKRNFTVFFSTSGFKVVEILPNDTTVDANYFCTIIDKLAVGSSGPLFLHMDNAPPHRAKISQNALERHNITKLPHPPYSPDLAPSDFWLFGLLKGELAGRSFGTESELQEAVLDEIHKITTKKIRGVFNEWLLRLEKCVRTGGEYVHITD